MSGLEELLANATPGPWRASMAAVFAGEESIAACRGDDFARVDSDARLIALAPDLARLALDMGEALRAAWDEDRWDEFLEMDTTSLLARLDGLAAGKETAE